MFLRTRRIAVALGLAWGAHQLSGAQGDSRGKGTLTIDQLIHIKHPSDPVWSPDSRNVAFVWDEGGVQNLYLANALSGNASPVALTAFKSGTIGDAFWSNDSKSVYFSHEGGLWKVETTGTEAQPANPGLPKGSDFVLSRSGTKLAYVVHSNTGDDLVVRDLQSGKDTQAAHNAKSISRPAWSPDEKHIAYGAGSEVIHHDEAPAYSGAKIIYVTTENTPGKLFVIGSNGGAATELSVPSGYGELRWVDANHITLDRGSKDFKRRIIYVANVSTGKAVDAHEDVDDKFWSMPYDAGQKPQPSPDGKWIAYLSDSSGWDHLYVMPAQGGTPAEVVQGHFESWRPEWSHDSKKLAFDGNSEERPGDRELFVATINGNPAHASVKAVTSGRGTNTEAHWSPDDKFLVYQHTDPQNSADLFTIEARAGAEPKRLSSSMPAGIDHSAFVEPEFVHFPGADGQSVPGWLFVPKNLDKTKKHPAIVWIHGDGINQNYDGWHVQRNYAVYYSFHQYLLQQGYVVFAPDYRGSIGYGRAWREGVYLDVGGKDAKDAWMSANYLKTLAFVDPDRIGVWGLSYGGFFTLIAMTDQPTLFRAGVDVAGVVDFRMYDEDPYHGDWTESRMGVPEQHPDVYKAAAPISHIGELQHPLLILHGTSDVNVPYLESVRLIDQALKQNKGELVKFMMYPGEFHYFTREHVLADAWRRVDEFFALNLKN